LPRSLGLCEMALEIMPSESGPRPTLLRSLPLIVNNLGRDNRFKYHPFVLSRLSLRFYAAIPICTESGFNIGTLSVMDDVPRGGLSEVDITFLGELAITIMAHLDMVKVKEAHQRNEKMVKGLGEFVGGRNPLHEWWLDLKNNKELGPKLAVDTPANAKGYGTAESRRVHPRDRDVDPTSVVPSTSSQDRLSSNMLEAFAPTKPSNVGDQCPAGPKQDMRNFTANLQDTMLSANLKDMFSRASNIIQKCIEVDGTIFLDASIGTFGGHTAECHRRLDLSESVEEQSQESIVSGKEGLKTSTGDTETSELSVDDTDSSQLSGKKSIEERDDKQKPCEILGLSTAENSILGGDEACESYIPVTETFLQSLLQKYPRGQVFDLCEEGSPIPSMTSTLQTGDVAKDRSKSSENILLSRNQRISVKQAEAKAIRRMLPEAHHVVFSPLWDSHRERWFAGSFAWTTQSSRVLTRTEDLNYLDAFGNSIMADVARLDVVAADQAKSDFISSISHELRTPLHGILASVEFLQDTAVDLFQSSMIDTIEKCGRTLLDTIQHVLDFAKINNFTRSEKKKRNIQGLFSDGLPSGTMGLNVDIDLSVMAEEVIDSAHAGHEFQVKSSLVVADEARGFPSDGLEGSRVDTNIATKQIVAENERIDVVMDIGWRSNWVFNTQAGALRRILMNLFGNALKYTDVGWVKVSLQSNDIKPTSSQSHQSVITITVSDSGRGISQEFLQSHLFTPFTQESSMNPGSGLGLSIVLRIVRSLGGSIDVKSEQGVGTEVKVSFILTQSPLRPPLPLDVKYEKMISAARHCTSGLTLGLVGFDTYSSVSKTRAINTLDVETEPLPSLRSSLQNMAAVWFDMKVAASASWKVSPPDIYITNESQIHLKSI
jgi:signal transduction histidine kinase